MLAHRQTWRQIICEHQFGSRYTDLKLGENHKKIGYLATKIFSSALEHCLKRF